MLTYIFLWLINKLSIALLMVFILILVYCLYLFALDLLNSYTIQRAFKCSEKVIVDEDDVTTLAITPTED